MLTTEEVKNFLEVDQTAFDKFLKEGKLPAYKIGGTYVRFRKEDVLNLRSHLMPKRPPYGGVSPGARIADFWRFNNFYIISILIVLAVIWVVTRLY